MLGERMRRSTSRSLDSRRQRQWQMLAMACLLAVLASGALLLAKAGTGGGLTNPGSILLVTAHPDDETIFMAPVITSLHKRGLQVFLLCLTNGGAHGLGDLRQRELTDAAQELQIDAAHLTILNDTRIQDGHNEAWEEEYVANIVRREVARRGINTIITFDENGVTGHVNHEGCYNGVRHYVSTCQKKGGKACPAAWALETTDDFRRYSSVLDILPSAVQAQSREDTVMFINRDIFGMFRAMSAHKSQSRWWRHVLLTRYTFVNTLERIKPLVLNWAAPLPQPARGPGSHLQQQPGGSEGSRAPLGAPTSVGRTALASRLAGGGVSKKRSAFLARMSRRFARNLR